jgi:hypothetical protein
VSIIEMSDLIEYAPEDEPTSVQWIGQAGGESERGEREKEATDNRLRALVARESEREVEALS